MKYTHIKDCWSKVRSATTIEELEDLFDEFPRWSGDWEVQIEDNQYVVINSYYDTQCDNWETDYDYLDIEVREE